MIDAKTIPDGCIRELAMAICIQAAMDYKRSLQGRPGRCIGRRGGKYRYEVSPDGKLWLLRGKGGWHPANQEGIEPPEEYEKFFNSLWFQELSGIHNSERAIEHLRKSHREKTHKEW